MRIDVALCQTYLDMPAQHWTGAQAALDYLLGDALGACLVKGALAALAAGDAAGAKEAFGGARVHAERFSPRLTEGVYPAIFAAALPSAIERLRGAGIGEEMIADSLGDYGIWARAYEKQTGHPGFGEMAWTVNFFAGRIVQIGRLQYERTRFHAPYLIARRRADGVLLPIPLDGLAVDANGFLAQGAAPRFHTRFELREDTLHFCAVDTARARILPDERTVRLEDVELLLSPGAPVMDVHIPEAGPLTPALVTDSLKRARAFFEARGEQARVAHCESWLLDPALMEYGAGSKNILAFQARFLTFPEDMPYSDAVSRVFGRGTDESAPERLPEKTSLARGLKAYLCAGKPLRNAGGVIDWDTQGK